MKTVSNTLKNALKQPTTQRKGRILVGENYYEVYNVKYYADAYNEGNVIGNAIASQLDFEMEYIEKFDTFKYFDGVWTGNDYEYVDMGTFHVFDEKDEDDFNKHITAFDNLIKFNIPFNDVGGYPKTLFQELQNVCSQAGVQLLNATIPNGNFIVDNNQFVNGESLKTVLKQICSISGNYAIIKDDMLVLQLKNNTNEIIDKSQHEPVDWKRRTYGINQVIIGVSNVEGEYVIRQDEQDIAQNGVHKLVINDNLFAYTEDKRDALIDALFQQVKGFGYVPYEMTGEWLNYSEIGDTVTIDDVETIVLRIEGSSPKGLESKISAPAVIDSSIEYLDNTNDVKNQLKRTELIVDKQNQEIQALVESVKDIEVDTTLTKQVSGNPITIEDAGAYPCENFIVEGKSEQETTNGYQLVDFNNPTGTSDPESYSFDGETLTYTSAGDRTYGNVHFNILDIIKNNPGKTLYFSFESYDFSNGKNACVQLNLTNNGTSSYLQMVQTSGKVNIINIPEDTSGYTFAILAIYSNNSTTTGTSYSVTIKKPMLSFTENASYEKYTGGVAGPNPDYPSEIETVKGIENLFNGNTTKQLINNDGSINSNASWDLSDYIQVKQNKEYTLSHDDTTLNQSLIIGEYDENKTFIKRNVQGSLNKNTPYTITTSATTKYVRLNYNNTFNNNNFQFEEGSIAHPFVPYGRYLYNKITGKNKFNNNTTPTVLVGANATKIDKGVRITQTSSGTWKGVIYVPINLSKYVGKTVRVKSDFQASSSNKGYIGIGYGDSAGNNRTTMKNTITSGSTISFVVPTFSDNNTYLFITLDSNSDGTGNVNDYVDYTNVIVTIDNEDLSYEPYKENIVTYDLKKENHINIDDLKIGFVQNSDTGELIENANFTCTEMMIKVKPNTTYIYIADSSITRIMRTEYDSEKIFNSSLSRVESSNKTTFKTQATTEYIRIAYNSVSTKDFKLYEGTGTDDYYELASINDIKDELDETTGVLTKRIGKVVLDGSESGWSRVSNSGDYIRMALNLSDIYSYTDGNRHIDKIMCSHFTPNITNSHGIIYQYQSQLLFYPNAGITTLDEWKTWLSENNVELWYELAEEETIQLEPTEIELFKGTNNIYTLDDLEPNMNITYLTDTKLNAQYATKSELKVAEGNIKSEINATLENEYATIEQTNAIEQKITDTENSIMLKVNQKANTTDVNNAINELTETTEASLELKLDKTDNNQVVAMINASADEVNIDGKKIALANFEITDDKLMSDITPEHDFTQADVDKVYQYLLGQTTLTPQEIAMYDTSGNGTVDILDLLQIQKVVRSGISSTNPGKFEIDTSPRKTEIIKFYNSENQLLYYIGYLDSKFNEVSCNSLSTSRLDANNIRSGICVLNSTDVIWVDFGTTFENVPNVVITPYTTTTGTIAPKIRSITNTGFEATIGGTGVSNVNCCWIAIG